MRTWVSWTKPLTGALVLLLGLTFAIPPVAAGESQAAPAPGKLAAAVGAKVAATPVPARALAQATPAPSPSTDDGRSFFKKPAGVATLVLMAVGTGYMIHSAFKDNDPVHSPFR